MRQDKLDEAGPLLRSGYEGMRERANNITFDERQPRLTEALDRLIAWAEAVNNPDEAERLKAEKANLNAPTVPDPTATHDATTIPRNPSPCDIPSLDSRSCP